LKEIPRRYGRELIFAAVGGHRKHQTLILRRKPHMVVRSFEIRDFGARASLPDFPIGQDADAEEIGRPPHGPLDDVTNAGIAVSVEMIRCRYRRAEPVFRPVAEVMKRSMNGNPRSWAISGLQSVAFNCLLCSVGLGRAVRVLHDGSGQEHEPDFGVLAQ
jgi:hypothetical protein